MGCALNTQVVECHYFGDRGERPFGHRATRFHKLAPDVNRRAGLNAARAPPKATVAAFARRVRNRAASMAQAFGAQQNPHRPRASNRFAREAKNEDERIVKTNSALFRRRCFPLKPCVGDFRLRSGARRRRARADHAADRLTQNRSPIHRKNGRWPYSLLAPFVIKALSSGQIRLANSKRVNPLSAMSVANIVPIPFDSLASFASSYGIVAYKNNCRQQERKTVLTLLWCPMAS